MSEKRSGPVAPGEVVGAQGFFRKRKRAYFRAERRGDITNSILIFLVHYASTKRLADDLARKFYG